MAIKDVIALILGGGQGARLHPLTKLRAKPAVPIGGKYRLIDIPISNCLNSGVHKIYVLTQFLSESLHRHIYQTYKFDLFSDGFVYILAAEQTPTSMAWYQGTADAVRKQIWRLEEERYEDTLILSGDHLYRMDYSKFIRLHREERADVTIAVQPVSRAAAPRLGILRTDDEGRVIQFREKPPAEELDALACMPGENPFLASMGVYVFRTDVLKKLLENSDAEDFGRQIIPATIETQRVYAYTFDGYWEDIGTVRSFYEANLALTLPDPPFDFYDPLHPIYTRPRFLPPSQVERCDLERTVLSEGCLLQEGANIRESVIGLRSIIGPEVRLTRTVMLGADYYETPEQKLENRRLGRPDVGVGRGCAIEGAIIDKNARIGAGVIIRPRALAEGIEAETEQYTIRDGIVIVPKNVVIPDGTII